MKSTLNFILVASIGFLCCLVLSCSTEDKLIDIGGVNSFDDVQECFISTKNEWIINSQEEYDSLIQMRVQTEECITYGFPTIDFDSKTLLGKLTSTVACNVYYRREVFADSANKHYLYKISISSATGCDETVRNLNWISVPKLPEDYSVEFEIIQD